MPEPILQRPQYCEECTDLAVQADARALCNKCKANWSRGLILFWYKRLVGYAKKRLPRFGDAEDAVTDALETCCFKVLTLNTWRTSVNQDYEAFGPSLLATVKQNCWNQYRKHHPIPHSDVSSELMSFVKGDSASDVAVTSLENAEIHEKLKRAVSGLPTRYRDVIELRFYEGMSPAETAAILDVKIGTVKSRTSRALNLLREDLEEL